MDADLKSVLLKMVEDLTDLRANQDLLSARLGTGVSLYAAGDAKTVALKEAKDFYSALKARVESL